MTLQEQGILHGHKGTSYHLHLIPCACGQDAPAPKVLCSMTLLYQVMSTITYHNRNTKKHMQI